MQTEEQIRTPRMCLFHTLHVKDHGKSNLRCHLRRDLILSDRSISPPNQVKDNFSCTLVVQKDYGMCFLFLYK
jgi:hypothetical protein